MGEVVRIASFAAKSNTFSELYKDGMTLIEEVAQYLDGAGRNFVRQTDQSTALEYSRVSMELTTTLMQLASWLLNRRAINSGEQKDDSLRVFVFAEKLETRENLPITMNIMIEQTNKVRDRILSLHEGLYGELVSKPVPAEFKLTPIK